MHAPENGLQTKWNALILCRDYTEHICPDPFPWPEDDSFLTVAPDSHVNRIEHSLLDKVETRRREDFRRKKVGESETSVNHILDGMMERGSFVFASHANIVLALQGIAGLGAGL